MNALLGSIFVAIFFSAVSAELYQWDNGRIRSRQSDSSSESERSKSGGGPENFSVLPLQHQNARSDSAESEGSKPNIGSFQNFENFRLRGDLDEREGIEFRRDEELEEPENIEIVALKRGLEVKRLDSLKGKENLKEIEAFLDFVLKGGLEKGKKDKPKSKLGGEKGKEKWKLEGFVIPEALKKSLGGKGEKPLGGFGGLAGLGALPLKGGIGKEGGWKQSFGGIESLSALKQKEIGKLSKPIVGMEKVNPLALSLKAFPAFGKFGDKKEGAGGLGGLALKSGKGAESLGSLKKGKKKGPIGVGEIPKKLTGFGNPGILKALGGQLPNLGLLNHAIIIKSYPILSHDWW